MYCQNGSQTTGSGRDGLRNDTRRELSPKENLINWTVTRVDDNPADRIHQWLVRQITISLCNLAYAQRHGDVIKRDTAIRDERVDHYETTAEFCVSNHNHAIAMIPYISPIGLDMLDADTDISPMKDQRTVFHSNHQAKGQRSGEP